jgi:2-oxoglutarate dehydrogenase E2 component (dihydrolipoamide succinyltransferase)
MADVSVPEVGESITEGLLVEWAKKDGDYVETDEPLFVLETDKITLTVDSEAAGALKILVLAGEGVQIGQKVAEIDTSVSAPAAGAAEKTEPVPAAATETEAPAAKADAAPAAQAVKEAPPAASEEGPAKEIPAGLAQARAKLDRGVELSPAVRRLVEESGVDPQIIPGTGKDGRLTKEDVIQYLESGRAKAATDGAAAARAAPSPAPAPSAPGPSPAPAEPGARETRVKMSPMRQRIAQRLIEAQQNAAILTTFNEIDMSRVIAWRARHNETFMEKHGVKLGFMSFFVKAAVDALKTVPEVNARIEGHEIVYNHYFDIGVAVGTEQGLVVPVIRDADRLSFDGIEKTLAGLAEKARNRTLELSDLMGGVFTISNGGIYGNMMSTPIINPPQSGILGMHTIKKRPVAIDDEIAIRPMMYVALSYDHRLVDGKEAVTFLKRIVECIENPERLLLEI